MSAALQAAPTLLFEKKAGQKLGKCENTCVRQFVVEVRVVGVGNGGLENERTARKDARRRGSHQN